MISIIGAGPVGSYAAYLLAKSGKKVNVYEEHDTIGLPVQCSGGVTSRIKELIPIKKEFLVNKLNRVRLFSPNRDFVDINLKDSNFIVNRTKFDRYLAEKAKEAGAKYFLNHKFLDYNGKVLKFNKGLKKTDILIGADGPNSSVARATGLYANRKLLVCLQARISGNFDRETICGYLHTDYNSTVIPENNKVARIALIARSNVNQQFKNFLKKFKGKVREYNSGLVPLYDPKLKIQRKNVYLVGDAAVQVKASTFGGIVIGMLAAKELANAIIKGKDYEKLLYKKGLKKELNKHLSVRKRINRCNNSDFNYLLNLTKKSKIKKLLEKYDRDNLKKYASKLKLLLMEPRLFKFLFRK